MQAVVLAAGFGKRMRPLTDSMPKPLIPVNGKPFLWYVLKNLQKAGFDNVIIVGGYKIEMIGEFLRQHKFGATVINQKEILGTAHAIASAKPLIDDDFVVLMSDNLCSPFDLKKFMIEDDMNYVGGIFHNMAEKYGNLAVNGEFLEKIVEKPKQKLGGMINAGIYKFTPEIFSAIRKVKKSERGEYEITDAISILCNARKVKIIKIDGYWLDMGVPEDIPFIEEFLNRRGVEREY